MANYSTLKAAVADVVKTNGEQTITGANLQAVLLSIINSVGGGGYIFKGVATPSTDAGTPDENVFYIGGAGTYANFGTSVVVPPTKIAVFKYDGTWTCEQVTVENGGVFDISAFNAVGGTLATYSDLATALGTNGANIPVGVRKGGMSIKFVQSSDNKYVQYLLTTKTFSAIKSDWHDIDDTLIRPAKEDFAISDGNRNAVLIIDKGEIKTKYFDSAKTPNIGDNSRTDLDVTDEEDNILVRFADGHIKTKYFNSKDFTGGITLDGKKVVCIGDSITYGQGLTDRETEVYHAQLAQKTGCNNNNQGVSGTGLCTNMTNGLSGSRFITRATSATLSNADIIVVFGGTNDFTYDSKAIGAYYNEQTITPSGRIGNKEKVAPTDTDTFSGALHELITHIRGISDAPIIFITPLHRSNYAAGRPNSWQANVNGDYLSDYIDAIKNICADYSVPVLDLYSCYNLDFNDASMRAAFSVDGIHPNKAGHTIICELLYRFIINNINI